MNLPAIETYGLSKSYSLSVRASRGRTIRESLARGGHREENVPWALNEVSFTVQRGEIVGILGENGAGKSTLLKVLARITEPTKGHALVRGKIASLLGVGAGFHPELTGRENIFLNAAILGMPHADTKKKLDAIADYAGLTEHLAKPVKYFSTGMSARLAFSLALHRDPEILLFDEWLAVCDLDFQARCLDSLRLLARRGAAVLWVNHETAPVVALCDRAMILERGMLAAIGNASEVASRYSSGVFR